MKISILSRVLFVLAVFSCLFMASCHHQHGGHWDRPSYHHHHGDHHGHHHGHHHGGHRR